MAINFLNNQSEDFFSSENYLNRIITLDRFIEFQENKFVFVSPTKWSDPYEKAFLQAKYDFDGKTYSHPLKPIAKAGHNLYAQCWTAGKQTEAMWKGFAPNEDGVMIKMSTLNLLNILTEISRRSSYDLYVGKVSYEDSDQLYNMKGNRQIWNDIQNGVINERTIGLLYKKRRAFDYEKEYRILAVKKNGRNKGFLVSFSIEDILNQIEYLKFDPRMGEKLFEFTKTTIQSKYAKLDIHKSRLYKNPIKRLVFGGALPREINDEIILN
jgi:Protein of unknown function (DUF2971)